MGLLLFIIIIFNINDCYLENFSVPKMTLLQCGCLKTGVCHLLRHRPSFFCITMNRHARSDNTSLDLAFCQFKPYQESSDKLFLKVYKSTGRYITGHYETDGLLWILILFSPCCYQRCECEFYKKNKAKWTLELNVPYHTNHFFFIFFILNSSGSASYE